MTATEGGLSLEMRAAIDACAHRVSRGLAAIAEREAVILRVVWDERPAMLRAVQDERTVALHALAECDAETSAGCEALAVDRAVLD